LYVILTEIFVFDPTRKEKIYYFKIYILNVMDNRKSMGDLNVGGRYNIKVDVKEGSLWNELICFRIVSNVEIF
jgi:hypothetical protein